MFNQVNGLPLHPLAVHASVVFVPLAAVLGVLFAIPRTRAWARLPLLIVSLGAVVSLLVSRQSGLALDKKLGLGGPVGALIVTHKHRANVLIVMMLVFAAVAVVAYVMTRPSNTASSTLTNVVSVVLVVGAVSVAYQTYRVGDIGARALWNPTGQVDYGSNK